MGAGRKTQTFTVNGHAPPSPGKGTSSTSSRNLRKSQLGGVIFGCKNSTIKECLFKQIFGLPAQHFMFVKNINPGLPLFLFNYSDRKLHGIFEAASPGKMNINPYGWTEDGSQRTLFPAQVQIRVRKQCCPLPEEQFRPIIAANYYTHSHFWFELDHAQTSSLISKLSSFAVAPSTSLPMNRAKWRMILRAPSSSDANEDVIPHNGDTKKVEGNLLNQESREAEKDLIYMQLKELALNREKSDSTSDRTEDAAVMDDFTSEKKGLEEALVPDNFETSPDSSSSFQSVISQLMGEIEELKVFKMEHVQKTDYLEQKLVVAENEIHNLKKYCMTLEPTSTLALTCADETVSDTSCKLDMDSEPIYVLGGYDGESWLSNVDLYSPSQAVIKSLRPMTCVRSYAATAKLNGEIYTFGGGNDFLWYDTVESYNPANNQWISRPSLNAKKGSLAGATVNEKIFALGGGDGVDCYSDVEMFDADVGRWISTRSMLQKRFALSAVEFNGALYASGGYDGKEYLRSVERFDPREHCWTGIESMNLRRGGLSMVVLNEKLYALGGFDGSSMVSSIEIYDPRLGTWMNGEPMHEARGYAAAAVSGGAIYVFGGVQTGENVVDSVERYEEGKGWQVVDVKTIGKRCFSSAIVLLSLRLRGIL